MSIIKDDPREVLEILNSLGFVGITAPQLKAFMKDLKLYRKIRERERQQRKEEMKRKIIGKHQSMIKEVLRERDQERKDSFEGSSLSSESDFCPDDSMVKIKVKCVPSGGQVHARRSDKENRLNAERTAYLLRAEQQESCSQKAATSDKSKPRATEDSTRRLRRKSASLENLAREPCSERDERPTRVEGKARSAKQESNPGEERTVPVSTSGRESMRAGTRSAGASDRVRARSTSGSRSTARSGTKSFIRPWKLQPDVQKGKGMKRSDPVTLYQKYQQEWSRVSFPGEAKRTSVRWAVRERMLGTDPRPAPLPKTQSVPILRRN